MPPSQLLEDGDFRMCIEQERFGPRPIIPPRVGHQRLERDEWAGQSRRADACWTRPAGLEPRPEIRHQPRSQSHMQGREAPG